MGNTTVLNIQFDRNGTMVSIHPVIMEDNGEIILVDTGYPNQINLLRSAMQQQGIDIRQITQVVITHHDVDHMGGAAELKRQYPHIRIVSSAMERDYIDGTKKLLRLEQMEKLYDESPETEKAFFAVFVERLKGIEKVGVDTVVHDGDLLPNCTHIQVVATPGHLPGHISLYDTRSKTLISADALLLDGGKPALGNPLFTTDMEQAIESARKLAAMDIDRIICYHGGTFEGDCRTELQRMLFTD